MKFLIVDDHAIVRRGLRQILDEEYPRSEFGEAHDAGQALDLVARRKWDLMLLDITMPGRSGLDLLQDLRRARTVFPVLVLSMHSEDEFAVRVLRAGAAGYLNKETAPDELVNAVKTVMRGAKYISPSLAEKLATELGREVPRPRHEQLSDREFEVLRQLASGRLLKEIAADLSLSSKTVSTYRTRILQKMRLRSNADLVRYALHHGLAD